MKKTNKLTLNTQSSKEVKQVFIKKAKDSEISEMVPQESESARKNTFTKKKRVMKVSKKERVSQVITNKSGIIVSFDEEYLAPVISQKKTYDFRSWRADPEVKRMWVYINKPVQSLMYILEVDSPIEYPKQIPNDNAYSELFNRGKEVKWKFAYRIKHLYKLNEPIGMKELKAKYGIHPPQKLTYVSKYPQLVKNVIVESQEKIF